MPTDPDAYLLFQDPADSIPHIVGYESDSNSKKYFNFQWFENRYAWFNRMIKKTVTTKGIR